MVGKTVYTEAYTSYTSKSQYMYELSFVMRDCLECFEPNQMYRLLRSDDARARKK